MKNINEIGRKVRPGPRGSGKVAILIAVSLILGGCYLPTAKKDFDRDGISAALPWWCSGGSTALTQQQCLDFSAYLDIGVTKAANSYSTVAKISAAGGSEVANHPADIGVPYTSVATPAISPLSPKS